MLLLRPRIPVASRILWGPRCYLVPRANGCLLVGATGEDVGFDESTDAEAANHHPDVAVHYKRVMVPQSTHAGPLNDPFGGWVYWGRAPLAAEETDR